MKNRVVAMLLATVMTVSLIACGKKDTPESVTVESVTEESVTEESVIEEVTEESVVEEEEEKSTSQMGYNLIDNGDLSAGLDGYWFWYTNGGMGSLDCVDGEMVINIKDNGKVEHAIQIYYDGFALNEGSVYKLSFDVSSTIERQIDCRIQMNGGDYHAYVLEPVIATPDMQHIEVEFTMNETSDPAPRFCFNMGYLTEEKNFDEHTIKLDNFELYCTDESNMVTAGSGVETPDIQVNQIGYRPGDAKKAVFTGEKIDSEFKVVDAKSGKEVYSGKVSAAKMNDNTEREEAVADFSDLKTPGVYKIVADKCGESYEFEIGDNVYDTAFEDAIRLLYLQRCGTKTDAKIAGDFAHEKCHSDKATIYGTSNKIDVTGGWHDAGDYGRYVVAGSKTVADLLLVYELYPEVCSDNIGIPESGNGIPDVLDEAKYELDWMLKMQDKDGGVYHKVTCAVFPETVMPESETDELLVAPKSTTATGDFAAVMAMASRLYADIDKAFADKCLDASKKAFEYLDKTDGGNGFKNPSDIVTGEYDDAVDTDERLWASAELYKATGDKMYSDKAAAILAKLEDGDLGWAEVTLYGAFAYATSKDADKTALNNAKNILKTHAGVIKDNASKDSYQCGLYLDYPWGSNMNVADAGMALLLAQKATGENNADLAKAQLDYLFGNNGTSYCFLTGYGTLSPVKPHHRPSQFVGAPMPGMLIGGPNQGLNDPYAQAVLAGKAPALCYVDNDQSYSCNEITIYWNSPLIFLLAGVIAE